MGFDAGSIKARLELDREPFNEELDAAKEEGDQFEGETYTAKADLDKAKFDEAKDEIAADRDEMEARPIDVRVEVSGKNQAIADLGEVEAAAIEADATMAEAKFFGSDTSQGSILKAMLAQGETDPAFMQASLETLFGKDAAFGPMIAEAMATMGISATEGEVTAEAIMGNLVPSTEQLASSFEKTLTDRIKSGDIAGKIGKTVEQAVASSMGAGAAGGIGSAAGSAWEDKPDIPFMDQLIIKGITPEEALARVGLNPELGHDYVRPASSFDFLNTGEFIPGTGTGASRTLGSFGADVTSGGEGDLASGANALEGSGGGGGGILSFFSSTGSAASEGMAGMSTAATAFIALLPIIVAGIAAITAALGGMVAGFAIGGAGLLMFGVSALKAYGHINAAYKDQVAYNAAVKQYGPNSAQAVTALGTYLNAMKGLSPAAKQAERDLSPLHAAFHKAFSFSDNGVYKILDGLEKGLTRAAPAIGVFAKHATGAMGGFFDKVDGWLGSEKFNDFMGQMSSDVGPIMSEFGQATVNLLSAGGSFLEVFGKLAKGPVGKFFERFTADIAQFFAHVKMGEPQMKEIQTIFNGLGAAFSIAWTFLKPILEGFFLLGVVILKFISDNEKPLKTFFKALGTFLGDSMLLITAFFALLGDGVEWFKKHWPEMEKTATSVWQSIDRNAIQPFADSMVRLYHGFFDIVHFMEEAWDDFYGAFMATWHWIDGNIIQPIETAFDWLRKQVVKHVTDAVNTVTTIWHGLEKVVDWIKRYIIQPIEHLFSGIVGSITGALGGIFGAITSPFTSAFNAITGGASTTASKVGQSLSSTKLGGSPASGGTLSGAMSANAAHANGLTVNVDARGASDPVAMEAAAKRGVHKALSISSLTKSLASGAA